MKKIILLAVVFLIALFFIINYYNEIFVKIPIIGEIWAKGNISSQKVGFIIPNPFDSENPEKQFIYLIERLPSGFIESKTNIYYSDQMVGTILLNKENPIKKIMVNIKIESGDIMLTYDRTERKIDHDILSKSEGMEVESVLRGTETIYNAQYGKTYELNHDYSFSYFTFKLEK